MRRCLIAGLVSIACLGLAGEAAAKRWVKGDRDHGILFVIDGRKAATRIVPGRHARALKGTLQRTYVRLSCVSNYGSFKSVGATAYWKPKAIRTEFRFRRDVSRRLSGASCLLERGDGHDVAAVGFGPKPGQFFAAAGYTGAGPAYSLRRYLRIRDARNRIVVTVRGQFLKPRLLPPGNYTLTRFEYRCEAPCKQPRPPQLRCGAPFRVFSGQSLSAFVFVSQEYQRCGIVVKAGTTD